MGPDFCNVQVPCQVHRTRPPIGGRQLPASSNRSASRILLCVFVDVQVQESEDSVVKSYHTPKSDRDLEKWLKIGYRDPRYLFENLSNNGMMTEKSYCGPQLADEEYEI